MALDCIWIRQWSNHHWFRYWLVTEHQRKFHWNLKPNSYIFIQENAFENVLCIMVVISSQPQCVNTLRLQQNGVKSCKQQSQIAFYFNQNTAFWFKLHKRFKLYKRLTEAMLIKIHDAMHMTSLGHNKLRSYVTLIQTLWDLLLNMMAWCSLTCINSPLNDMVSQDRWCFTTGRIKMIL